MTFKSSLLIIILAIILFGGVIGLQLLQSRQNLTPRAGGETVATLDDYWQGRAEWKFYTKLTNATLHWGNSPESSGSHVKIVGNTWYLFFRKPAYGRVGDGSACSGFGVQGAPPDQVYTQIKIMVRKSTDAGMTWSDPVEIVSNDSGSPWECVATDGDAFYDTQTDTWHYIFQCMARDFVWNGCHVSRSGADPMGKFDQDRDGNPVIRSGDLWSKICVGGTKCKELIGNASMAEEGTFEISRKDADGYFYVTFHGASSDSAKYIVRGIAKTKDFKTWIAGDASQGVAADAIFSPYDAKNWRENWDPSGPLGSGAGSLLEENGWYYQISEITDGPPEDPRAGSLAFNKHFDWGMTRSQSLTTPTGQWEQLPAGNPFYYPAFGTDISYGSLFRDPGNGKVYFEIARSPYSATINPNDFPNFDGIYFYELVPKTNLLQNNDIWKCTPDNWSRSGGTNHEANMVANRDYRDSSDGNCSLSFNCGAASCEGSESIYQDVDVTSVTNRTFEYGGKFALSAESSGTGNIELDIWEFYDGAAHHTGTLPVAISDHNYQESRGVVQLDPRTTTVRYQWYIRSPQTMRADELFVRPTQEVPTPTASPVESPVSSPVESPVESPVSSPIESPISSPVQSPAQSPVESPSSSPISSPQGRIGDVNNDGAVNILDLGVITEHYEQTGENILGDVNHDGTVNILDFGLVVEYYDR